MTSSDPFLPPAGGGDRLWDRVNVKLDGRDLDVVVVTDGEAVVEVSFGPVMTTPGHGGPWRHDPAAASVAVAQLRAYAAGELQEFDLALRPHGTAFRLDVWRALMSIPFGATSTYGAVAAAAGRPGAARAVGSAVGANPIGIVIPCHRVIGADGSLTGYSGGMENKISLLALEGVVAV